MIADHVLGALSSRFVAGVLRYYQRGVRVIVGLAIKVFVAILRVLGLAHPLRGLDGGQEGLGARKVVALHIQH